VTQIPNLTKILEELTLKDAARELDWLKNNPDFEERPATIAEFLGPKYLNIDSGIRPGLRKVLVDIFGDKPPSYRLSPTYAEAMMTGAIGIGKTTFASIVLPYMCHWVLCMKNPQAFFTLLPGSRIAFMMMSTSESQAREVIFADVFARIDHSVWFKKYPYDPSYKNQIRFTQKDIWIIPGDSAETTFEGYNILGGILDEMDSHRITPKKDYALEGYNTISNRITSRFQDRGLLILIGQMKKSVGFAATKYTEFNENSRAYTSRMTIWESFGWDKYLKLDGTRDSFWFDRRRKIIVPDLLATTMESDDYMEIPNMYRKPFTDDPDKALKDLAGIPPLVGNPFIGMTHKIDIAQESWHTRFGPASPVLPVLHRAEFSPSFVCTDGLKRAVHIDIAYSDTGDALGIAMGHVRELKEIDNELRPVIVFDFLLRLKPMPGQELILADVRQIIYDLKDNFRFRIKKVTLDGFQSTDTIQQLSKRRIPADYLSVDRNLLPYQDLRDAIYEERIEFPKYMVHMRHGDGKLVNIAYQELTTLIDNGKKIDHPEGGSKDVADAMAGVCATLMDDKQYRRGVSSTARPKELRDAMSASSSYDPTKVYASKTGVPGLQSGPVLPGVLAGLVLPGGGDLFNGIDFTGPSRSAPRPE
jgi:hypothetical protein